MSTEPLPSWPLQEMIFMSNLPQQERYTNYERTRAEAAISRLRRAVAALKYCRDHGVPLESHRQVAADALADIGDVP